MMAQKLRFSPRFAFESESARRRHCSCSRSDAARRNIYRLGAHRLNTRSKNGEGTFEGLSNVWLFFYQRFDAALLLWSYLVGLDSWVAVFHSRRCSYIRTDDPSTKTGVHCELEHRGLRSQQFCERCGYFFFSPGAPVSSFLSQPIFTVIPVTLTFNKTKPALSSIAVVTKAVKRTDRTSLCCIWEHPQRCFPHFDKNRAKHRRTVFSMNKVQESRQRSTNWRRRHLGDMQQQPRWWPDYDKCEGTKLR